MKWSADITVALHDDGAAEIHALVGTVPGPSPCATINVAVDADDLETAFREALLAAAKMATT